jgi:UDP-GlcNAc3NAcA epimerase
LHRPYNVDDECTLREILSAFSEINEKIVFAVHPRTLKNIKTFRINLPNNIIITEPLGYFDFLLLQKNAIKIITDSGGIQKEAYFVKKPCITLRPETEWVETIECMANTLVISRKKEDILKAVYSTPKADFNKEIYGNGKTAEIILNNIIEMLK